MPTVYLQPVDVCGCGDEGFLTTRTIPVDLIHGVGQVRNVPVYHCRSPLCTEYTLPLEVSRRLDELAEEMEDKEILEQDFAWPSERQANAPTDAPAPAQEANTEHSLVQAFTLQFANREYEDARVVLVIPGEAVFFQSTIDKSEHYVLRHEPEAGKPGIWFSFSKFYQDDPTIALTDHLEENSNEYIKELGLLGLEEVEDSLLDEFGNIL